MSAGETARTSLLIVEREDVERFVQRTLRHLSPQIRAEAEDFLGKLSLTGQLVAVLLLFAAFKEEKFEAALALLKQSYEECWSRQEPEIRGEPALIDNSVRFARIYRELGIPLADRD